MRIASAIAASCFICGCTTIVDPNQKEMFEFQKPGVSKAAAKRDSMKCWAYANSVKMTPPDMATGVATTAVSHGVVGALAAAAVAGPTIANAHKPYSVERVRHQHKCMLDKGYGIGWAN